MPFRRFLAWFMACWAAASFPLFVLHGVPGVDTPNHAVRIHLLDKLRASEALNQFYQSDWKLLPNLALDLVLAPWAYLFHIDALLLMKLFIVATFGITGLGFAWLNREWNGKWSYWGLCGFLLCYSYILGFGFNNFLFGLGLALTTLAWDRRLAGRNRYRSLILALSLPALILFHLTAFGLFLMAHLVFRYLRKDLKSAWPGTVVGTIAALIILFSSNTGTSTTLFVYDGIRHRITTILTPLFCGSFYRDLIFQSVLGIMLAYCLIKKWLKLNREAFIVFWVFLAVVLVAPHQALTSAYISARLPLWLLLIVGALFAPREASPWPILLLVALRSADMSSRYLAYNPMLDQVKQDVLSLPEQSLVYQAAHEEADTLSPGSFTPALLHANCFALFEKDLYLVNTFAAPSQQPLRFRAEVGERLQDRFPSGDYDPAVHAEIALARAHIQQMKSAFLRSRPAYLYFVKPRRAELQEHDLTMVVDRPRYVIIKIQ